MRFLVVSPDATHPQDEGDRLRAHDLLTCLKRFGHGVDLVVAPRRPLAPDALDAMRAAWDRVVVVPPGRVSDATSPVRGWDDPFPPALETALQDLAAQGAYDAVLVRHLHLGRALRAVPAGPLRIIQTGGIGDARMPAASSRRSWAEEVHGPDSADLLLAPDEESRARLQALTRAPVAVLGFAPDMAPRTTANGSRIGLIAGGDLASVRAASVFLSVTDLREIAGAGGVLRIGGAVAARLGAAREGLELLTDGVPALDDLDLLVLPQEAAPEVPAVAVQALAQGLPVIGTMATLGTLPSCSPWHAAPDAAAVAGLARRWLSSPGARAAVAADSAEVAARHREQVRRQQAAFRDAASLRTLVERPRALAVTARPPVGDGGRLGDMARAAGASMDMDVLLLGDAARGEPPSPALLGARGHVLAAEVPATGGAEAFAAVKAACESRRYDLLLLDGEDLSFLGGLKPGTTLRVLDAQPGSGTPSLERCARLARFDAVITRSPGQQLATGAALPGHAWYLPSAAPLLPCPDRARPARRIALTAEDTPAGMAALRWFLDQAWPALATKGLELLLTGRAGPMPPDPLPPGVVRAEPEEADPLASADLAANVVTEACSAHVTRDFLLRGLPCVLSEDAAAEMGDGEGPAFLIARSRTEVVAHLLTLAGDAPLRRAIGEAAFRLGRRRFGQSVASAAARGLADLALSLRSAA